MNMDTKNNFLMREARKAALQLKTRRATILPITKWGNGEILFVSNNENKLFSTQVFELNGEKFFIGTKK